MAKARKILCVDDEPTVLQVTLNVLRDAFPKHEFIGLEDSRAAQAILTEQEIAVVLTDLSMPNVDGAQILKQAYECSPTTVTILVTGRASAEGLIRAINEGYLWKCIEKPWNGEQMSNLVKDALELYETRLAASGDELEGGGDAAVKPPEVGSAKKISINKGTFVRGSRARVALRRAGRSAGSQGSSAPKIRINKSGARKLRIMDKRYGDMELIQEGGSGAVYKSFDKLLNIPVAIKIISEKVSSNAAAMKELASEARIAMGLSHTHIVRLHNIEQGNNFYYLVMEYIDGETLRDMLKRIKVFPPDIVLQVLQVLDDALGYAHRRGIFHRDIKPDNIMVTSDGLLKMIDFGLACLGETFRRDGEIAGTPYYMSPEEMVCEMPDQRTDVFSVGVMMHEFLYGSLPLHGDDSDLDNPLNYVPVANPKLPEHIQKILQKSFAKDRAERWQSMHEFSAALSEAIKQEYELA
jgi:CheY-like chemotaxis protein